MLLKTKPTCGWLRLHKIVGVPPVGVLLHLVHLHLRVNLPTCHLSGRNIVNSQRTQAASAVAIIKVEQNNIKNITTAKTIAKIINKNY